MFVVIFAYFGVPLKYQYRVLFWGIIGAIALRLLFVVAAAGILHYFDWAFYFFGAFLVYTAIKLATSHGIGVAPGPEYCCAAGRTVFARRAGHRTATSSSCGSTGSCS